MLIRLVVQDDTLARAIKGIKFLVIDEADRMIENGHFAELESIVRLTRRKKCVLLAHHPSLSLTRSSAASSQRTSTRTTSLLRRPSTPRSTLFPRARTCALSYSPPR